jgi:hypothetical protein
MAAGSRVNSGSTKNGLSDLMMKCTPVCRNVDARHLVDELVDLGDHHAVLECGRLDHSRRVFGVRAGVEVAFAIGAHRGDQRDLRGEIDEVSSEQLEVGMNRTQLDLAAEQHARDACRLRTGIPAERRRTAPCAAGSPWRGRREQCAAEQVGLLLVVAFEANPIAGLNDGFHQARRVTSLDDLSFRQPRAGLDAGVARCAAALPIGRGSGLGVDGRQHLEIS